MNIKHASHIGHMQLVLPEAFMAFVPRDFKHLVDQNILQVVQKAKRIVLRVSMLNAVLWLMINL